MFRQKYYLHDCLGIEYRYHLNLRWSHRFSSKRYLHCKPKGGLGRIVKLMDPVSRLLYFWCIGTKAFPSYYKVSKGAFINNSRMIHFPRSLQTHPSSGLRKPLSPVTGRWTRRTLTEWDSTPRTSPKPYGPPYSSQSLADLAPWEEGGVLLTLSVENQTKQTT